MGDDRNLINSGATGEFRTEVDRDMGFGEKVTRESRQRLLNRDGSFNVERTGLGVSALLNPYHILLNITWIQFILLTLCVYFFSNVFFGMIYAVLGDASLVDTSEAPTASIFMRGFFFSVQTFATIGYGTIHPVGIVANLIVTIESYYSMIITALLTGIVFARFARPTAKIMFSENAVVAPYQAMNGFMVRLVNARKNQMIEVDVKMIFSRFVDENGRIVRRFALLDLEREHVAFLPLALTAVHPITPDSPMFGMTAKDFERADVEISVLISGMDETYAQIVHTRTSYKYDEIVFGAKFANIYNEVDSSAPISIDVRKLSKIEKI